MLRGVLIDAGAKSLEKVFLPFFGQHELNQVTITHQHENHTGIAAYQQKLGKTIYMHEFFIEGCQSNRNYPLYRKLFWRKRDLFKTKPMKSTFTW